MRRRALGLIGPIGPIRSSTTPSECALRLDATLSETSCPGRPDVSEFLAVFAPCGESFRSTARSYDRSQTSRPARSHHRVGHFKRGSGLVADDRPADVAR